MEGGHFGGGWWIGECVRMGGGQFGGGWYIERCVGMEGGHFGGGWCIGECVVMEGGHFGGGLCIGRCVVGLLSSPQVNKQSLTSVFISQNFFICPSSFYQLHSTSKFILSFV